MEWSPIIRIVLRYLAGFLVAKGIIDTGAEGELLDPSFMTAFESVIGVLIGVVSEVWYNRARKSGGAT